VWECSREGNNVVVIKQRSKQTGKAKIVLNAWIFYSLVNIKQPYAKVKGSSNLKLGLLFNEENGIHSLHFSQHLTKLL
jgi:hypothetical protein